MTTAAGKLTPAPLEATLAAPPDPPAPETAKADPSAAIAAVATPATVAQLAQGPPPTATRITPEARAEPPSHAAPAAQIAPALVSLGTGAATGRLTVRLDPAELGQVRIQIDRPHDGAARVQVTAERPETMALLMRDAPALQRTLDQAGIPADGRTLTFHLAPQDSVAAGTPSGSGDGSAFTGAGMGGDGSGARGFGEPGNGGARARGGLPWTDEDGAASGRASRWMTAALDITA